MKFKYLFEYKIQGDFMDFKSRFDLDSHLGRPPTMIYNRKTDRSEIIYVALYIDTLKNNLSLLSLKETKIYVFLNITAKEGATE